MKRMILGSTLVATLLLAGCTPTPAPETTTPPVAEPSSTAAPTPEPTIEPLVTPEPLFEIACDDLVAPATYASLTRVPLEAASVINDAFEREYQHLIETSYKLQQAQATQCRWTNGLPQQESNGNISNTYSSLGVVVLPNAKKAWANYAEIYGEESKINCGTPDEPSTFCSWDGLVDDDTWASINFSGMKNFGSKTVNKRNFQPIIDAVKAGISSAPRGDTWTQPAETTTISAKCPNVLTAAMIADTLGDKKASVKFGDSYIGGTGIQFEAERIIDANPCRWWTPQTVAEYGTPYEILRGGEWAWEAARAGDNNVATAKTLPLDNLPDGDTAWIRTEGEFSNVDLILGGNWISIVVYPETLQNYEISPRDAVKAFAQSVVTGYAEAN